MRLAMSRYYSFSLIFLSRESGYYQIKSACLQFYMEWKVLSTLWSILLKAIFRLLSTQIDLMIRCYPIKAVPLYDIWLYFYSSLFDDLFLFCFVRDFKFLFFIFQRVCVDLLNFMIFYFIYLLLFEITRKLKVSHKYTFSSAT